MRPNRVLLVSLLFLILLVSFLYYAFPNILFRPRIDAVPAGAYVVPWMSPNPSLDTLSKIPPPLLPWNLDSAMTGALRLDVTFRLSVSNQTRVVPSTVYLGHDANYLYVGAEFSGMGPNPFSNPGIGCPNYFDIKLDVPDKGVLTFPEAGSFMEVCVSVPGPGPPPNGWDTRLWWAYEDEVWQDYVPVVDRAAWNFADEIGMTVNTIGNAAAEYDSTTGTLVILFSRHLNKPGYYANSLQMKPGERWVMGFNLELGFANPNNGEPGQPVYGDIVDGWPINTYPYWSNDCSWWPKLVIDLTKPPATFPGKTTAAVWDL
jgi:hypothetical protein